MSTNHLRTNTAPVEKRIKPKKSVKIVGRVVPGEGIPESVAGFAERMTGVGVGDRVGAEVGEITGEMGAGEAVGVEVGRVVGVGVFIEAEGLDSKAGLSLSAA